MSNFALSEEVVIAVANLYSIEELQEELKSATLNLLSNPDRIISASTGAGASYTKALNMSPKDLVELLSYALKYKQYGEITTGGSNQWNVCVYSPFNR